MSAGAFRDQGQAMAREYRFLEGAEEVSLHVGEGTCKGQSSLYVRAGVLQRPEKSNRSVSAVACSGQRVALTL